MAIELETKPKEKNKLPATLFMIAAILIFAFAFGTYLFFEISSKNINENIKNIDAKLVKTDDEKALEDKVVAYQAKVSNYEKVFNAHEKTYNIFTALEETCHPDVWLNNFKFDSEGAKINVSGTAKDFTTLGQQVLIWEGIPTINEIKVSSFTMSKEGGIDFVLLLTFGSQIFK